MKVPSTEQLMDPAIISRTPITDAQQLLTKDFCLLNMLKVKKVMGKIHVSSNVILCR